MEEIWKDIPNYEGLYQVSNLGRVKSLSRFRKCKNNGLALFKERVMKNRTDKKGYSIINLSKDSKKTTKKVHRLVILAFKGYSKLQVNHINGDKSDNRLENLEYCTNAENVQHAFDIGLNKGRKGEAHHNVKLTRADAERIKYGHQGLNQKEIANIYGINKMQVSRIRSGKRWRHI